MTDDREPMGGAADARLRAGFASAADVAGAGSACPATDVLWESAGGRSDRRQREAVILHLGECGACAAAWRLARDLQGDGGVANVVAGPARWFRQGRVQLAALAALVVIAVGIAVQLRSPGSGGAPEFRGREGDWIQSLIPEASALPRERCLLRWTPGPAHTVYDVRVTTEDLAPIARSLGSERAEFLVPASALSRMPAGRRIVWQVTAILPDASKADSRSFTTGIR